MFCERRFYFQRIDNCVATKVVVGDYIRFFRFRGNVLNPRDPRLEFVNRIKIVVPVVTRRFLPKPVLVIPAVRL